MVKFSRKLLYLQQTASAYAWSAGYLRYGLLSSDRHRRRAGAKVAQGLSVSFDNGHEWLLLGDAAQSDFSSKVAYLQSGKASEPTPYLALPSEFFFSLIDWGSVADETRLFLTTDRYRERLAGLCRFRAPIQASRAQEVNVPSHILQLDQQGRLWAENYDAYGKIATEALLKSCRDQGVAFPGVIELRGGEMPIVGSTRQGRLLSRMCDIEYTLLETSISKPATAGSLPLVQVGPDGLTVESADYLPSTLFRALLPELAIERPRQTKPSATTTALDGFNYSHNPEELRLRVLQHLGWGKRALSRHNSPFVSQDVGLDI